MVLVGEDEQLGFYASHTGCIKGAHALSGVDAVVLLAMNTEDGGIPLIYEAVGAVLVSSLSTCCLVFVPVSIIVLPVREPVLFCLGVHSFEIEGTIVSDKALEALVVMAGQIVNREAAKAGTYGTHVVLIYVRKVLGSIIDS